MSNITHRCSYVQVHPCALCTYMKIIFKLNAAASHMQYYKYDEMLNLALTHSSLFSHGDLSSPSAIVLPFFIQSIYAHTVHMIAYGFTVSPEK